MIGRLKTSFSQNRGFYGALVGFAILFILYNFMHPRGFSTAVLIQNANEAVVLAFVAVAQTIPVLVGGLDLSVGAVMTLSSCIASVLVTGSLGEMILGMILSVAAGTMFGLMNGLIVVYGRIQPIIATLATGAIAIGLALFVRPQPGGDIDGDLNWAVTNAVFDFAETYGFADDGDAAWLQPIAWIPVPLIVLTVIMLLVWVPYRRSVIGRTAYAIGSAEGAAYMSGLPIARAKIMAFTLAGFFAGCGGLYLAIQTSSGNADVVQAGEYTLKSIASVVIGGTSLLGGVGTAVGSIFGAFIIRVIEFFFRIGSISVDPLLQTLFQGIVLLVAVSLGSLRLTRIKNRMDVFR